MTRAQHKKINDYAINNRLYILPSSCSNILEATVCAGTIPADVLGQSPPVHTSNKACALSST